MKTKITLMTIIATVALAGAAISANAQCGYGYGRVVVRGPRVFIPAPRVYVPAPRVWIPPAPVVTVVPPAPVVGYYGGGGYYGRPVYHERYEGRWDRDDRYRDHDHDGDDRRDYRRDRW